MRLRLQRRDQYALAVHHLDLPVHAAGEQAIPDRRLQTQRLAPELDRTVGLDQVVAVQRHDAAVAARRGVLHDGGELVDLRHVDAHAGGRLRSVSRIEQARLARPDLVDRTDAPAGTGGSVLGLDCSLQGERCVGRIDLAKRAQLARELDEVAVGVTHVDRLDHLVRRLDRDIQSLGFEALLPRLQFLGAVDQPGSVRGVEHMVVGQRPHGRRGLRAQQVRSRGSRRKRSCCRCRCRRRSAGNRGAWPDPSRAPKSRAPAAGRACRDRTRWFRAASRWAGRCGRRLAASGWEGHGRTCDLRGSV